MYVFHIFIFQLLCIIVEDEGDIAAFKDFVPTEKDDAPPSSGPPKPKSDSPPPAPKTATPPAQIPPSPKPTPAAQTPPPSAPPSAPSGGKFAATPYARTLAAEKGIDLNVSLLSFNH